MCGTECHQRVHFNEQPALKKTVWNIFLKRELSIVLNKSYILIGVEAVVRFRSIALVSISWSARSHMQKSFSWSYMTRLRTLLPRADVRRSNKWVSHQKSSSRSRSRSNHTLATTGVLWFIRPVARSAFRPSPDCFRVVDDYQSILEIIFRPRQLAGELS